jgi:exosortase/archaeosortase family protein
MRSYERFYLILFLLVITPFPYIYHLTSYLQISSSVLSGHLLSLFGVVNEVSQGRIVIDSGTFVVGPASSGIRSFLVLPTFSIILLIWRPYKIKLGLSFILLSFLTAQFYNMIRVTLMLVTAIFTDPYWAYDAFHDKGNTVIFFIALTTIYWLYKKVCQK